MANGRLTDKYGQCTVNYKEQSLHCKEQEKLVHPVAGSHRGNETPLWPASPCAPPETARSSYSPGCRGSAPQLARAPPSCVGKRKHRHLDQDMPHQTHRKLVGKKEERRCSDGNRSSAAAAAQGIKKSLPTKAGKTLFSYCFQVVSQNTMQSPMRGSVKAEGKSQPCPRSTCNIISAPTKKKLQQNPH